MSAPDRIWAWTDKMAGGLWSKHEPDPWGDVNPTEYVPAASLTALQAENDRLQAKVDKLAGALEEISGRHIPDQPAAFGGSELDWAFRQHGQLRSLAREALAALDKDAENG